MLLLFVVVVVLLKEEKKCTCCGLPGFVLSRGSQTTTIGMLFCLFAREREASKVRQTQCRESRYTNGEVSAHRPSAFEENEREEKPRPLPHISTPASHTNDDT